MLQSTKLHGPPTYLFSNVTWLLGPPIYLFLVVTLQGYKGHPYTYFPMLQGYKGHLHTFFPMLLVTNRGIGGLLLHVTCYKICYIPFFPCNLLLLQQFVYLRSSVTCYYMNHCMFSPKSVTKFSVTCYQKARYPKCVCYITKVYIFSIVTSCYMFDVRKRPNFLLHVTRRIGGQNVFVTLLKYIHFQLLHHVTCLMLVRGQFFCYMLPEGSVTKMCLLHY